MFSVLLLALVLVPYFIGVPVLMWDSARRNAAGRWQPRAVGTQHLAVGAYRDVDIPRFRDEGPPSTVQFAALGSWILGTMFVPGLLAGLYGLIAMGLGLVSIPGLVLAWRLFFLGRPLMLAAPGAARSARSAALFARVLNAIVLALCLGVTVWATLITSHGDSGAIVMAFFVGLYAVISMAHATLLVRAADHLDAESMGHTAEPTGLRVTPTATVETATAPSENPLAEPLDDNTPAARDTSR